MSLTSPTSALDFTGRVAAELNLRQTQVSATAKLLAEGATVPFISRYRKEVTGSLDEVAIGNIRDRMQQLAELEGRREAILKSMIERNLLTDELKKKITGAQTMTSLEDIYAPFRPKRRTRATIAKERGLEELANFILSHQSGAAADPFAEAAGYVDAEKEVPDVEAALAGARDIIAEQVSDHAEVRAGVRKIYEKDGTIGSSVMFGKENDPEAAKYRDYFDWNEPLDKIPSHRLLAIRRGEKEGFLMMKIAAPEEQAMQVAEKHFVEGRGSCSNQVKEAVADGCKRLLFNSMETEMRMATRKKADEEAIRVFAENLRELLLASPLGQKRVLAVDPGFRTGCKLAVLDAQGQLLHHDVVYLVGSTSELVEAAMKVKTIVQKAKIEAIAIGNGTGSRETEAFIRKLGFPPAVQILVVNESGASIYSASEVARREFPDHDVTVRGAVSIGRRLMDPLAELVKIDAKSIGVGQYQHDVDQNALKKSLDECVESCVNAVGVEVNTASRELLSYVSGLNATIAENVVAYRNENGAFKSRSELKKVPRLGDKAFEQAAGFLRIRDAKNPLDASGVHPERYALVEKMAADLGCQVADFLTNADLRNKIKLENYVSEDVGLPTLKDILAELAKPGRDPRKQFEAFSFTEGVEKPQDLKVGMQLPGIVTNVTKFGAFVDVGVHQDGLVHISQLCDHFVQDPSEVVKVNQKVTVTVMEVDLARNRISLSMKSKPDFEKRGGPGGGGGGGNSGGGGPRPNNRNDSRGGGGRNDSGGGGGGNDWFSAALAKSNKK